MKNKELKERIELSNKIRKDMEKYLAELSIKTKENLIFMEKIGNIK